MLISVNTTVLDNTAQNSSDNLPSYPPDNHHSKSCSQIKVTWKPGSQLPVIGDREQLSEAELSHVTLKSDQRVNVHEDITAVDDLVHLMDCIQQHL